MAEIVYVDAVNGNDANAGTEYLAPVKTFLQPLRAPRQKCSKKYFRIGDTIRKSLFRGDL